MIKLGNPAVMLPTNAITDLATHSMQPVPFTPASPLQFQATQPLAVVNPNAYRHTASFDPTQPVSIASRADLRRNDYEPGMRGLGEDGFSKNMVILGIIGIAAAWYLTRKGKRA